jgi:hypothetical protein
VTLSSADIKIIPTLRRPRNGLASLFAPNFYDSHLNIGEERTTRCERAGKTAYTALSHGISPFLWKPLALNGTDQCW